MLDEERKDVNEELTDKPETAETEIEPAIPDSEHVLTEGEDYGDDGSDEMPEGAADEPERSDPEAEPTAGTSEAEDEGVPLIYAPGAAEKTKRAREEENALENTARTRKENNTLLWKSGLLAALACIISFGAATGYYSNTIQVMNDRLLHAEERIQYLEEKIDRLEESGALDSGSGFDWSDLFGGQQEQKTEMGVALGIIASNTKDGVVVKGFSEGSKAEEAGLIPGDTIRSIDGTEMGTIEDIHKFLEDKKAGDIVKVTVEREGKETEVSVELVEAEISSSFSIEIEPQEGLGEPELFDDAEVGKSDQIY